MFPVNLLVSFHTSALSELQFVAAMRRKKDPDNFLVCYPSGTVSSLCNMASKILKIPHGKEDVNLCSFCPELEPILEMMTLKTIDDYFGRERLEQLINDKAASARRIHVAKNKKSDLLKCFSVRKKNAPLQERLDPLS